jgi:hypothetical protein
MDEPAAICILLAAHLLAPEDVESGHDDHGRAGKREDIRHVAEADTT